MIIISEMKQNQSLYRPFPGEEVTLKPHDHLSNNKCLCQICESKKQKINPEIHLDLMYETLKTQKSKILSQNSTSLFKQCPDIEEFAWYLRKLAFQCKTMPNFPILDVFAFQKGQMSFYIFFQNGKCKLQYNSLAKNSNDKPICKVSEYFPYSLGMAKNKLLQRKISNDIEYQKAKHKETHPNFEWAQLDHDSEKLIKQFEKKIQYIDHVLNRVAIIKQHQKQSNQFLSLSKSQEYRLKDSMTSTVSQDESEKVLSKYEFCNLFDKTRIKVCELEELHYIQMFPIMYGEQQQSYIKQIKYFRKLESGKALFKQAQSYVLAWLQKNETLEKMQQSFINQHFYKPQNLRHVPEFPHTSSKRLNPQAEQEYLMYQSYKFLLHIETQTNIQISQCLLEFLTPNNGHTFYLKSIRYIKYQQKHQVQVKENQLPTYKHIEPEDYIDDLQKEMRNMFEKVEYQFERLNKDWDHFQNKTKNDRKESDRVFKQVRGFKEHANLTPPGTKDKILEIQKIKPQEYASGQWVEKYKQDSDEINLHKILKSNDQQYKEEMLGLNHRFKFNDSKASNVQKSLNHSKTSKK